MHLGKKVALSDFLSDEPADDCQHDQQRGCQRERGVEADACRHHRAAVRQEAFDGVARDV
jgi:hypothetical protein